MQKRRLALGMDLSTQSLSAVILDIDSRTKVYERSLDYLKDPRLDGFGIQRKDYIVPPRTEGEADQPPKMFFASLDASNLVFASANSIHLPIKETANDFIWQRA